MAQDIDITLPDGGEITVPGWSTEETQKQIYTLLKSMQGVDKETVKKLEEAQRADQKNSKKEIDALKDLGKDLKQGMQGGFLGGLGKAASAATSSLGFMGKTLGITAGAVTAMGGALVAGVTAASKFATGYTDAIKPLVNSGIAFGDMGSALNDSIKDLNTLGFSSDEAARLINNSSTAFLRLGAGGLSEFTSTMKVSAKQFERFGMTTNEATEYVATELEERARAGIIEKLSTSQMANLQMSILDDQIKATRRLGKTVDEIADFQKQVKEDPRIAGLMNAVAGDESQTKMMEGLITQLSAVPGLDGTDVADIISAEIEGRGVESTEAYSKLVAGLGQVPGALESFTGSIGASVQAISADSTEGYAMAQKDFNKSLAVSGEALQNIIDRAFAGDEHAQATLSILNQSVPELVGGAARMAKAGEKGLEQLTESQKGSSDLEINKMSKTAASFDNAVIEIQGAFTEQITSAQQAMVGGLDAVTKVLGDDSETGIKANIKSLASSLGDLATTQINAAVTGMQDMASSANTFVTELNEIANGPEGLKGIADRIFQASVDNIIMPLANSIGSIFTAPTVIAAAIAGIGTLMLAMRTAVAGLPGVGTSGDHDGVKGGDGKDGKGKGKGGKAKGMKLGRLPGLGILSGALELLELSDDLGQINNDLESGKIENYEANIARTAETSEAVGGAAGAAGGALTGAALGSAFPIVGTAIGGLIGGAIGWYAGREGTRAIGEGLAEAIFTPEHIALQNELNKIEERLSGDIDSRTRQQLETRQKQVESKLELIKPVEQSQPINPNNIPIMVQTPPESDGSDTTTDSVSQDGIPTQEVLTNQNAVTPTDELLRTLITNTATTNIVLESIAKNTKGTVGAIAEVAQR